MGGDRFWGLNGYLLILIVLILVLAVKYGGVGRTDHYEQIPLVKRAIDSNFLKNDWFVNSYENFNVRFYFVHLMAFLSKIIGLKIAYHLMYVLAIFFSLLAVYKIAFILTKNKKTSILALLTGSITASTILGSYDVIKDILVPATLSVPFCLFSIYYLIKERCYLSAIFSLLATIFHINIGVHLALLIGVYILIFSKDLKKLVFTELIFFAFGSLNLVPSAIQVIAGGYAMSSLEFIRIIGFVRHPGHTYLFTEWGRRDLITSFVYLLLVIISFIKVYKSKLIEKKSLNVALLFMILPFVFSIIAMIFTYLIPVKFIVQMQFLRSMIFFKLFGGVIISAYLVDNLNKSGSAYEKLLPGSLIAAQSFIFFPIVALAYIGYFGLVKSWVGKKRAYINVLILCILVLAFIGLYYFGVYYIDFILFVILTGLVYLVYRAGVDRRKVVILAFTGLLVLFFLINHSLSGGVNESEKVYSWIKMNTDKESLFLIPPNIASFRLDAERAVVVDYKAFPFNDKEIKEWISRINEVTNNVEFKHRGQRYVEIKKGYATLTKENVLRLKERYGFDYALFYKPNDVGFKIAYQDDWFVVYDLRG